jgi:hypothetical protein
MKKKDIYVKPTIEVIEFEMEDSIAQSAEGSSLFEDIWNED